MDTREMMKRSAGMIKEDASAPCMLPRQVIDEYWPKSARYEHGYMDDLFMGVQKQMSEDYNDLKREMKPGKY